MVLYQTFGGRKMDTRLLKYFESIVRNKNITKAAQELHISQPSLSTQIKNFEHELGCKLLERTNREITLTEPGMILYKHAVLILQQLEKASKEIEDVKEVGVGQISIGAIISSIDWLCEIIPDFRDKYHHLPIKIKEMGPREIEEALINYDVHIGITSDCFNTDSLTFHPVFEEPLVLITPPDHKFKDQQEINFTDLNGEPLILYPEKYHIRQQIMTAFNQVEITPNITLEASKISSIVSLVSAGLGSALVFEKNLKSSPKKNLNVIRVNNPTLKRTIYTAIHKDRHLSVLIHDLHSRIIQFFQK